jgi:beta-lactamase regulating signal transducer with metallopeptidase domain
LWIVLVTGLATAKALPRRLTAESKMSNPARNQPLRGGGDREGTGLESLHPAIEPGARQVQELAAKQRPEAITAAGVVQSIVNGGPPSAPAFFYRVQLQRPWPVFLLMSCFAVSGLAAYRLVRSFRCLRRLKRSAKPADPTSQERFSRLVAAHHVTRPVTLGVSSDIGGPMAVGFRKPLILIPEPLGDQLQPDEFDQVLLHELAHISRWDDWINLAQQLLWACFCWHPAVLWVCRRLNLERELACDDWVICARQEPKVFAKCLVKLADAVRAAPRPDLATGMISPASHLSRRVEALLDHRRTVSVRLARARCASFCVLLAALAFAMQEAPAIVVAQENSAIVKKPGKTVTAPLDNESPPPGEGKVSENSDSNDPAIRALQATLALAKSQLAELKTHYTDNHPAVLRQQEAVKALESSISEQRSNSRPSEIQGGGDLATDAFPLWNLSATELLQTFKPFLSDRSTITVDERRNALVVTAPKRELEMVATAIRQLTSPANSGSERTTQAPLQQIAGLEEDQNTPRRDLMIIPAANDQEQAARAELRAQVFGSLLDLVKHETNAELRARALNTLPRSEVERNIDLLTELVRKDKELLVRRQALATLGSVHTLSTTETLIKLYDQLGAEQPEMRRMIVMSLGEFAAQSPDRMTIATKAVAQLKQIANAESDPKLRTEAIHQLGRLAQQLGNGA